MWGGARLSKSGFGECSMQIMALTVRWVILEIFRESHRCEGDGLVNPLWRAIVHHASAIGGHSWSSLLWWKYPRVATRCCWAGHSWRLGVPHQNRKFRVASGCGGPSFNLQNRSLIWLWLVSILSLRRQQFVSGPAPHVADDGRGLNCQKPKSTLDTRCILF